ncbi:MAG TPA: TetR/AcrR family transcriptional regulator [Candidatus Limnocylindria bacterium]|jgi:AcrR family transcriptional regulator|nr:TetR/AcrR family transcriptional regulator [Candidatus Limnocylindria bacterium]
MSRAKPAPKAVTRDPQRTRELILVAALKEFSRNGFAGARVDAMARRARVNKRMLYHYFGSKAGLFQAVLRRRMTERNRWLAAPPSDPAELLPFWFERVWGNPDWIRLLEWEALEVGGRPVVAEAERKEGFRLVAELIRRGQLREQLPADLDTAQLQLSMMALTTFPVAFPQLTRMVTGLTVDSPEFRASRLAFLRQFVRVLRPPAPVPSPAAPTPPNPVSATPSS